MKNWELYRLIDGNWELSCSFAASSRQHAIALWQLPSGSNRYKWKLRQLA